FFGASLTSDHPTLITPYFHNGDLLTYTRSHPWPLPPSSHETALGMSHLHSLGIVHGSLRASNVLVSDRGAGVVTDFGL
ncbi:kinase-like domain-containing protein, partial [Chytridium lagenaria]